MLKMFLLYLYKECNCLNLNNLNNLNQKMTVINYASLI